MSPKGKETHRKTSARIFPTEVTFDILSRLPIKTLLRFKCVSKQWRTLVSLPSFTSTHFTRSPASLIIHAHRTQPAGELWPPIEDLLRAAHAENEAQPHPDNETQLPAEGHVIYVYGPPNPRSNTRSTIDRILDFPGSDVAGFVKPLEFVGGPNGVVCVAQQPFLQLFTLWNPATRSSRPLPSPLLKADPKRYRSSSAGFGFDPSRDEYKVVHIMCHKNIWTPDVGEFFSLRVGSWKRVAQPRGRPIRFWVLRQSCEAVVNGVPYWRAKAQADYSRGAPLNEREMLVWFDVRYDAFDLEPYAWAAEGRDMCFGEIKDCLGVAVWEKGLGGLEVWVKEKENGYWSRRYRVGPLPKVGVGVEKVVGFYGDRVIVQQVGIHGNLIMLDLEKTKIQDSINGQDSLPKIEDSVKEEKDSVNAKEDSVKEEEDSVNQKEDSVKEEKDTMKEKEDLVKRHEDLVQKLKDLFQQKKDSVKEKRDTVKKKKDSVKEEEDLVQKKKDLADLVSKVEDLINVQDSLPLTFKTMNYRESFADISEMGNRAI